MRINQNIQHKIDILNNLTPAQVDLLLEAAKSKQLFKGEILFTEGSQGNCLYIVLQGTLTANIKHGTRAEKRVATLSPGDTFGEVAMLTGSERTATIQAVTTSLVMQITKEAIQKAGLGSVIYQNIARVLAERLMKMNDKAGKTHGFVETFVGDQRRLNQVESNEYDQHGWLKT